MSRPKFKTEYQRKINTLNVYIETLKKNNTYNQYDVPIAYFKIIIATLKIEEEYTVEFAEENKQINKYLEPLPDFKPGTMKDDIINIFKMFYNKYHYVRNNIETSDSINCVFAKKKGKKPIFKPKKGEVCHECNGVYSNIYHVPDNIWEFVTGFKHGEGTLCMPCFMKKADKKRIRLWWQCEEGRMIMEYPEKKI